MKLKLFLLFLLVVILSLILRIGFFLDPLEEDSGVFLNIGQGILNGKLPYRDLWDNKPPVIYYLDAVAIGIFGNNPLSVKIFEFVWQAFSSLIVFFIARKMFSINLGVILSIFYTLVVSFKDLNVGGNFTETYLLGFELLALLFVLNFFKTQSKGDLFFSGLFMGLVFMTKQSGIALFLLTTPYLFVQTKGKSRITLPIFYLLAFVLPLASFSLYFLTNGTFRDFIDQVFIFNWLYLKDGFLSGPNIIIFIKNFYQISKYLIPVLFLSLLSGIFIVRNFKRIERNHKFILILFILELFFVFLSGGKYEHYFLQITVSGVLLSGVAVKELLLNTRLTKPFRLGITIVTLLLFIKPIYLQSLNIRDSLEKRYIKKQINGVEEAANYIKEKTPPDIKIFVWGYKPQIYYLSQRSPATRYFYNLPMFYSSYFSEDRLDELRTQLLTNKPYIVVDVSSKIKEYPVLYDALNLNKGYVYKSKIDGMSVYGLKI